MKRLSQIVCVALFIVAAPHAGAADMSSYYGNTIVCTAPGGAVTKVWVKEGGKYTINRGTGDIQGTYTSDGDTPCFTETDPAPPAGSKPFCPAGPMHKIGDTWQITDPSGSTSQCTLKEGNS